MKYSSQTRVSLYRIWSVILALLLLAEYAPFPLPYVTVDWRRPPPVYDAIKRDPTDVAILEWPLGNETEDDGYTFWSIHHGKRLVNGGSGFLPRLTQKISAELARPDTPVQPFPWPSVRYFLLGIHPLRYLVVHNRLLDAPEQRKWTKLHEVPWARYVGSFGRDDRVHGVLLHQNAVGYAQRQCWPAATFADDHADHWHGENAHVRQTAREGASQAARLGVIVEMRAGRVDECQQRETQLGRQAHDARRFAEAFRP